MARKSRAGASPEDRLQEQYEAYPYPEADPADEKKRLRIGSPSHLMELNHFVFAGRRDFTHPFRVLVAGGGTGDATVMLAQQLADVGCPAEITHIDLSNASREIAEARVRVRGLKNVTFRRLSILDLPDSGLGPFDYIDCCGVLHHLEDPAEGLKALSAVLAEDGGMGVMLYGELGRTGVYPAQDMMRMLTPDETPSDKVAVARKLLAQLPPSNWLRRNPMIKDHIEGGDAGVYDLLLHSRDRAYRVPEIVNLAEAGDLRIVTFMPPLVYAPEAYISDPAIHARLKGLDPIQRSTFAELLSGNIMKHIFYLVRQSNPGPWVADAAQQDLIPLFRNQEVAALGAGAPIKGGYSATVYGMTFRFPMPRFTAAILSRVDGRRSIADIRAELQDMNPDLSDADFAAEFGRVYEPLNGMANLFLASAPIAIPG
ncbi:MAG: class I SAM-dependent methyltransferase [Rhodospirillales bacterium]|nr:class I SAM-dependent methyltransferase [Rhodospirillales bacterium]